MKVQVTIEDIDNKEIINVNDINNKNDFIFVDSYDIKNHLCVYDDGITINRIDNDHSTYVALRDNPYIEVITDKGSLKFLTKVVEFNKNFDIITIVYSLNDEVRKITIRYLGE